MDRHEAVAILRELQRYCTDTSPDRISLDSSNVGESSVGYRVQVKGIIDEHCREYLRNNATKRGLVVKEESDKVTIYRPR